MDPIISTALAGLNASTARLSASASRTVSPDADYVSERVEQIEASESFKANVAVLKTADRMQRTLLDMLA
jgi:flagellar basal body rod protein FlgC